MAGADNEPLVHIRYDHVPSTGKRRRLSNSTSSTDYDSFDKLDDLKFSPTPVHNSGKAQSKEQDLGDANERRKSRYKIHIPKNPELPKDAFFTQPPQSRSSPYRISHFYWQKPKEPSPPSPRIPSSPEQSSPSDRNVDSMLASSGSLDASGEKVQSDQSLTKLPDLRDDFDPDEGYEQMLVDLPPDAFSPPDGSYKPLSQQLDAASPQQECGSQRTQLQPLLAPLTNLRQTTLFGTQVSQVGSQAQTTRKRNWPLANKEEPATHHKLDREALATWVYPTNLGTIRDYQYSIVARGLYHNMLVALPTGLGKTFIAAAIMLNWFRWTLDAQIVFVAPTKPLVSQQVRACFEIAGIPRSATTMLTGGTAPGLRAEEWRSKRVFFMTPQTIVNDLKTGICDPKRLVLLVVDEAHRATGGYAYVEVVTFLKRFNSSFRILALTATPGASVESVQEVIDGLGISRVEIRTEESLDIRQYVHSRKIETVLFENSDEIIMVMDLFARALQPVLNKLLQMNAYWARDPMTLTPYGCNQARSKWMGSDAGRHANYGIKGMVNSIFSLLASLSHGIELLKFHGIGPFYHKVLAFRNDIHSNGKKGSKYARQINESEPFQTMMSRVRIWINNPDFLGHPKLEYLQSVVMNHFLDAGDGRGARDPSSTRIMVFSHYRDSAEEIARVLKRSEPMIRPHVFVGQANSKGSEGMDQKKQLEVIQKFQTGVYNVLVATSIGEEGLDIGEVDLIVCYDASASPIRMLQRMGRTGRKRAGNIVVTLMRGKEETNFIKAKDNYEKIQQEISVGTRFSFHDKESRRIVPRDVQPVVDKRVIDIPPENTQPDLPEPTKRGRPPKRPLKKFHMPDGVRAGFISASRLDDSGSGDDTSEILSPSRRDRKAQSPEPLPPLEQALLTMAQETEFESKYLDIQGDTSQIVQIPRHDIFPELQRIPRPTNLVRHGRVAKRTIDMLSAVHEASENSSKFHNDLHSHDERDGIKQAEKRARFFESMSERPECQIDNNAISQYADFIDGPCPNSMDTDGNLRDPVDDDSESSPLAPSKPAKMFYPHTENTLHSHPDSEEGLPDLDTIVKDNGCAKMETPGHMKSRKARLRKVIVTEDSDDG